jgi:Ca2+ regulator and membrane fusion protein Fig1
MDTDLRSAICAVDAANTTSIAPSSNGTSNSSDGTVCTTTASFNASDLSVNLFGSSSDVVPILDLALILQRKILVPLILLAAILMMFAAILFALAKLTQMKLRDPNTAGPAAKKLSIFKPATVATMWMAVCVAFAAAVATTMAVGALNFIIPVLATNISVTGGRMLQAFQYLAFVFGALFALGATLMLASTSSEQPRDGMMGDEYPQDEKNFDQGDYDESMMQQDPNMEGMEGQEQGQYPEGEYGEEQQQQYAEGQDEYGQQQQQYAEGGEYAQGGYAQDEYAQQQGQEQYPQQPQQPYP